MASESAADDAAVLERDALLASAQEITFFPRRQIIGAIGLGGWNSRRLGARRSLH